MVSSESYLLALGLFDPFSKAMYDMVWVCLQEERQKQRASGLIVDYRDFPKSQKARVSLTRVYHQGRVHMSLSFLTHKQTPEELKP